jgi:hypothetical protein
VPHIAVPFGPFRDRSQRKRGPLEDRGKPDLNEWRRSGKTFPQALKRGSAKSFMSELKLRRHDAIAAELRVGGLTWGRRAFDLGWAFAFTGFAYLRISCVFSTLLLGVGLSRRLERVLLAVGGGSGAAMLVRGLA